MNSNAASHRPLTEQYRPRRWTDYYQGLTNEPVATLAQLDERMDFSQSLIFSGSMGTGKTSAARQRGARRGCAAYHEHRHDPCGACDHCRASLAGNALWGGAYHELDATRAEWRGELLDLVDGTGAYGPALAGNDLDLPHVVALDEFHRARHDMQESILKKIEDCNVCFILMTTDPDRIIEPVRDRCLMLRFEPPTRDEYAVWLERVLRQQGIVWEEGVIEAFRDGSAYSVRQSLLQVQTLSLKGLEWPLKMVREHFRQRDVNPIGSY